MIAFLLVGTVLTLLLAAFVFSKRNESLNSLILLLTTALVIVFFSFEFCSNSSGASVVWISFSMFSGTIFLSRFLKHRTRDLAILSTLPLLLFLTKDTFVFGEFAVSTSSESAILFAVIGVWLQPLSEYLTNVAGKFLYSEENRAFPTKLILFGTAVFFAYFFQSVAGIFFLALGLAIGNIHNKNRDPGMVLFALNLLLLFTFKEIVALDAFDLLLGKNLLGLLVAIGMTGLVQLLYRNSNSHIWLLPVVAFSAFLLLILYLGTQKDDLGGYDAYLAAMLGTVLFGIFNFSAQASTALFLAGFTSGLLFMVKFPMNSNESNVSDNEQPVLKKEIMTATVDPFDSTGLSISLLNGKYAIVEEYAQLNFELGPKGGRTKGAFKQVRGSFQFGENGENMRVNVELPLSGLSTFNRFRDESLKEPEYFNVSQYPTMSFEGDDFAVTDDLIVLNGYFTMLGRRVDQVVEMKYVGSEVHNGQSYPILIGRGTIDRTRFGMRPDPKEGNVVNFNFRISLKK